MKYFYFLIIILLVISASGSGYAQAGWILRESNTNRNLHSISSSTGQGIAAVGDSGAVTTSLDAGLTWRKRSDITWKNLNGVTAISDKILCAVAKLDSIFRSTDGGITWAAIPSKIGAGCAIHVLSVSNKADLMGISFDQKKGICVTAGTECEAGFSLDSGKSWTENSVETGFMDILSVSSYNGFFLAGGGGLNPGHFFGLPDVDHDWTNDWIQYNVSLRGCDVRGWTFAGSGGMIFRSNDKGVTWNIIPSGTTVNLNSVNFADDVNGYICGDSGLILTTSDGGYSWSKQVSHTMQNLRSVHFTDAFHGFICGDSGVILTTANGGYTAGVKDRNRNALSLSIAPNPFSKKTRITFTLPGREQVKIKIYNLLGIKVASIADDNFDAGSTILEWNSENTPNGMYVLRLEADGKIVDSKVILEK
jgi:photosystem II stability/assembly factor-like uncharacterized protein